MTDRVCWAKSKFNYTFSDSSLLKQALTHRSASRHNNERLEFLGDALLNFCVASDLYELRPAGSRFKSARSPA